MILFDVLLGIVVLLLAVAAYYLIRAQVQYRVNFGVPGPSPHFLMGNSEEFQRAARHVVVAENFKKYGPTFVTHMPLGLVSMVFTRDPVVSHALVKNMEDFPVRNQPGFGFSRFIPLGLLGDIKGEQWRAHRRALSPLFSDRYLRWYTQAVNEELEGLQAFFRKQLGSFVNVHNALTLFTFDVIGRVGFGSRFKALDNPTHPMVRATNDLLASVVSTRPFFLQGEVYKRAKAARASFDPVVDAILDRKDALEDDEAKLNMLQAMQEAVDPHTGNKLTRQEIRDEIMTLLGAGHETTANTATWALYLLAQNPEALAKVRTEVDSLQDDSLPRGLFEFDQLPQFHFLKRVVFETLRLYPHVPAHRRASGRAQDARWRQAVASRGLHDLRHEPRVRRRRPPRPRGVPPGALRPLLAPLRRGSGRQDQVHALWRGRPHLSGPALCGDGGRADDRCRGVAVRPGERPVQTPERVL